jgi:hypothetical protein
MTLENEEKEKIEVKDESKGILRSFYIIYSPIFYTYFTVFSHFWIP